MKPELSSERNFTPSENDFFAQLQSHFLESPGSINEKLDSFSRYVPRQSIATFLARKELFDKILDLHGHIIECGVFRGAGLFTWANLSTIFEPYNHTRRIIGFDTFTGFPEIDSKDKTIDAQELEYKKSGGLEVESKESIRASIAHFDKNRFISQIPRVQLISGDAYHTIPEYVTENKHLVVALLYLDFDIYKPTRVAVEQLWERMPRGSIIAFDELNQEQWPGETLAILETIGFNSLSVKRFPYQPQISYAVKS